MHRILNELLLPLNPAPFHFSHEHCQWIWGVHFHQNLESSVFIQVNARQKKTDLFFVLYRACFSLTCCSSYDDGGLRLQVQKHLVLKSVHEMTSWWFDVCVHISPKKSLSQRVPSILSHHQLAVANAKAALERPGAISSRPLAWRPTVMRKLERNKTVTFILTFFGFNILNMAFLNYCIAWFQLNVCHPKKCRDYEAPACFVIWGDCRKKIISSYP